MRLFKHITHLYLCVLVAVQLFFYTIPLSILAEESRELQWTFIDKPGTSGNVVVHPSDVSEIAIGNSLSYALDVHHSKIYRSMSGGLRWEDITPYLSTAGATLPATKIAVAPGDASIVVAATDGGTNLYLSVDGGITWGNLHVGAMPGTVQSLAISGSYGDYNEKRDILIGTASFGDAATTGQMFLVQLGRTVPAWKNLNITIHGSSGGEISAVAFSPNYTSDQTVLAIASTSSDVPGYENRTFLCMAYLDISSGAADWSYYSPYSYPLEIFDGTYYSGYSQSSGDAPGVNRIAAGLQFPSSYSATASRVCYAFYTVYPVPAQDTSNAYRMDDTAVRKSFAFSTVSSGTRRYSSIALSGKTLVAGEALPYDSLSAAVRITSDAGASSPGFTHSGYPYGPGNAKLAWGSNTLYCGTGYDPLAVPPATPDESGFSISSDSGLTWSQVGLIDTTVTLQDVAVALHPQSIFITSTSISGVESVWRSASDYLGQYWGRMLAVDVPLNNKIIVRISPDYSEDYTLYVCETGSAGTDYNHLWMTHDRGNAWKKYDIPLGVIDMAVSNKTTCHIALPGGSIARSENSGLFWQRSIDSGLNDISMLATTGADIILVGGNDGDVAYSVDAGKTYTRIFETIADKGHVQVVTDTSYKQNKLIYAASGNVIYRWAIGESERWDTLRTTDAGRLITGMSSVDGVLYAAWCDNTTSSAGSGAERSLAPTVSIYLQEWDSIQAGAGSAQFDSVPTSLRYWSTDTDVVLWVIDRVSGKVMVYFDCLTKEGPKLMMDDNTIIGCDPAAGRNQEVNLTWEQLCVASQYQIRVAKDSKFTLMVADTGDAALFYIPPVMTAPALIYWTDGGNAGNGVSYQPLECGHKYYWKVRVRGALTGDIIRSRWSEPRAFTIKAGFRVTTPYYGPQLIEPQSGCGCSCDAPLNFSWSPFKETQKYTFELSENSDMSNPVVSLAVNTTAYQYEGAVKCNQSYFWRVMATEPAPSEWSAVYSFKTMKATATSLPPVVIEANTPVWDWRVIVIGIILVIVIIVLITMTAYKEREV